VIERWPRLHRFFSDPHRPLRVSAVLTLIALGLMLWSMLQPTPLPIMLAMTVAQGLGTLAFALYGVVIVLDILRARRASRDSAPEPSEDERRS
jgi:hypothetical protein